jgi:3-hydroxyacyl-CoA dehydrogenase/enoyl-CoA hydratase/3-hydroxybutyryl-CoA epimerase
MEQTLTHTSPVAGRVHITERNGVYILFLGSEEERVITLTSERMASLKETLQQLKEVKPKGLVISGIRENMFAAGADINAIQSIEDPVVGEELGKEGQNIFQMVEDLPCPTVAAVSGPCVGGGCELSLACDYRIISDHPSSQIGLPETKLGILPGWGGTQRLPRLVGIQQALKIILAGRTLRPKQARSVGLVHEITSPAEILARAEAIARRSSPPAHHQLTLVERFLTFTSIGRAIVKHTTEKHLAKETKGNYPAPPAALKAVLLGLQRGTTEGYAHEAAELGRLLVTPESRALVNLFFLTEGAKKLGKGAREDVKKLHTFVVGAGVMGAGIAGAFAQKGFPVILKDTSNEALESGTEHIAKTLQKKKYLSSQDRNAIMQGIQKTTESADPSFAEANFVVEAIVENLDIKKKVLTELSSVVAKDAILCTNTSSLPVSEIATGIQQPDRIVGMHFFNPVDRMPLVEIVRGKKTSDRTVVIVAGLATKLGKFPIVVEDVPGFLVNRVLTPYLNEAGALLLEGYDMREIDKAALKFGMPMGPIRLLDEVGLDVAKHVAKVMHEGYGERMASPGLVDKLVEKKMLGRKSGCGFYEYVEKTENPNPEISSLLEIKNKREVADKKLITDRLILSLVNEGIRCLDEGVAGVPGKESANQIDLGTVMGIGFPPFRGGLISYAESLGAKTILQKLTHLQKEYGERFTPHEGIAKRAEANGSFYSAV